MTLEDRVLAFVQDPGDDAAFDDLARRVFAYQFQHVPLYARFCERRGVDPDRIRTWTEIPALPVDSFKHGLDETGTRPHVFLSSGTSAGLALRSRHALSSLTSYRQSAIAHFRAMVLPDGAGPFAVVVLGPSAESHPLSSLGQMFSWCAEEFGTPAPADRLFPFDSGGNLDMDSVLAWLSEKSAGHVPVLILAVTSALTALFETLRDRGETYRLPGESRIVDTGGRKGKAHVFSAAGILKAAWSRLHVPSYLCVNEYGMTEMLSQFYDDALESRFAGRLSPRAKIGPPWVRTTVVDPATLEALPEPGVGLLRHVDLANWESVSALQTLDLARKAGRGFELCGRATGAETRGCSTLLSEITAAANMSKP